MNIAKYRKGFVAVVAAAVTVAALPAGVSDAAIQVFDAVAALLVILVPNQA